MTASTDGGSLLGDRAPGVVGRVAEQRAARVLELSGYRIIGRNVRTLRGEIDIVAWEGKTLCFIEVKSRTSAHFGGAVSAVDGKKQGRLWRAAEAYLAADKDLWRDPPECRFDVITVDLDRASNHATADCELHRNAFDSAGDP